MSAMKICKTLSAALTSALVIVSPTNALAQIASPSNAGQNSGNNTSGSSLTPISTPNFSPVTAVSTTPEVTASPDGAVTALPQLVTAVDAAIVSVVSTEQGSILSQVVSANAPAPLTGPESLIPDTSLGVVGSGTPELVSLSQLPSAVTPLDRVGQVLTVSRPSSGTTGTISMGEGSLQVALQGQSIELVTTSSNQAEIVQFAAVSIAIGLTPASLSLGAQLVSAGIRSVQAVALMSSLQGLANQTTLTSLSTGINTFNAIVDSSSVSVLQGLAQNPVFVSAGATLRAARSSLSGG